MEAYWRPHVPIAPPLETWVVVETPSTGRYTVALAEEMLAGRGRDNPLVVPGDGMSARRHARLRRTPDGLVIQDLGSTNGTLVNGRRIDRHVLHVGDVVQLGRSWLSFEHTLPPGPALPDEAARLLASICAAPEDDEPRLVLADWLVARGDPRGELIACQIAAETSVNTEASARAEELLAAHELAWVAPLPVAVASWTFRRGFLDCVWVQPGRDVAPLRAHHPLRAAVANER